MKELIAILEKIRYEMDRYYNAIDGLSDCDTYFSDAIEELHKLNPKMKKKERKALLVKTLSEKMPDFVKLLNEFDLIIEAMEARIDETKSKLENKIESLEEIEQLEEEIDAKKSELDL